MKNLNLQNNYEFGILEDESMVIELSKEKPIIEVNMSTLNLELDIDGENKDYNIDVDGNLSNELFDLEIAQYISAGGGSSNSKVYTVFQNDTSDLNAALQELGNRFYNNGDYIIISTIDKSSATGYMYDAEYGWVAFSGNATANNVLFNNDILCAGNYTQVGNVNKTSSGTYTIPAKGKSIADVFTSIFTQELQPSKSEPSVNISFPQAGGYEVGTEITPTYSVSLNSGSYTYGPATGVSATSWKVTDSNSVELTTISGSFAKFIVTDSTNYKLTAIATHTEGTTALTNIGNSSNPIVKIAAGTKSKTSSSVSGYRCMFYGIVNDIVDFDSAKVRSLTNGGKASAKKITIQVNGNANAKRICVILPTASKLKITNVMKTDGLATDITATYSKIGTVQVDGKNNNNLMASYDVWVYQPAQIDASEVHEITIG